MNVARLKSELVPRVGIWIGSKGWQILQAQRKPRSGMISQKRLLLTGVKRLPASKRNKNLRKQGSKIKNVKQHCKK